MLLTAKTALVTGAAQRLGAQIARTLHQNGVNLIIHYRRSAAAAEALTEELNQQRADSAIAIQADLNQLSEIENLGKAACAAYGQLDILVNNASSYYPTPLGEIDQNAFDDLIASNYKAPLFLAQSCQAELKKRSGCIVNMVDIYATVPLIHHSVYASAKAANQMLVKSLALELAPEIRVNGIAPGVILWPAGGTTEAHRKAAIAEIPLRRIGTPQAIADSVLFLVCNDYITGEIIRVDGGRILELGRSQ